MAPLRCHLLIGQPASGKSTLARALAPLLTEPGEPPAVLLSTDVIRAEVFGDAAVQGPWVDIQQRLHQRLQEAVAAGIPVIVDATHARRAHPGAAAARSSGVDRLVALHRPAHLPGLEHQARTGRTGTGDPGDGRRLSRSPFRAVASGGFRGDLCSGAHPPR